MVGKKMMKAVLVLLMTSAALPLHAGIYYGGDIDTYEPVTGLYYKAVISEPTQHGLFSSKGNTGVIINLNIFDPANGQSRLLFNTPQKSGIAFVLFEAGFRDGAVEFYGASSANILNNKAVSKRPMRDKLLIGVRKEDDMVLFVADKHGGDLQPLAEVKRGDDWHLDVKNAKLRIVHQTGAGIRIDSYAW
jgi:hypothetical protein